MSTLHLSVLLAFAAVGCGSSDAQPSGGSLQPSGDYIAGFTPPAPAEGYTRYVGPVIHAVPPGGDVMYCQWVSNPFDHDVDVLDLTGYQSKFGHHAVVYANTLSQPVGTSRECANMDQLTIRFLGGIGPEAGVNAKLPPGVAFRIPKGSALMMNTHFLNTSEHVIDGQAVVDLELEPASPTRQLAAMFANTTVTFQLPPDAVHTSDATCVAQMDMGLLSFSNHMHSYGIAATTYVAPAGGSESVVRDDKTWISEMQFNPSWSNWDVAAPLMIHKGDTVRTHCEWNNTTASTVGFPDEMCVGVGFFLSDGSTSPICVDGAWPQAQ